MGSRRRFKDLLLSGAATLEPSGYRTMAPLPCTRLLK